MFIQSIKVVTAAPVVVKSERINDHVRLLKFSFGIEASTPLDARLAGAALVARIKMDLRSQAGALLSIRDNQVTAVLVT